MERFIFDANTADFDYVLGSGDEKAMAAIRTADAIVSDPEKNMPILMIISFDLNTAGIGFTELAQFLYDNYSKYQITGLFWSITNPGSVIAHKEHYETEEEMKALKDRASRLAKETEDKINE